MAPAGSGHGRGKENEGEGGFHLHDPRLINRVGYATMV